LLVERRNIQTSQGREVVATDFSPKLLKEEGPRVLKLLEAKPPKLRGCRRTFINLIFRRTILILWFPPASLQNSVNIVQVLREAKRSVETRRAVYRDFANRSGRWSIEIAVENGGKTGCHGVNDRFYTLADYKEFFKQAGFPLRSKRVNLSRVSSITSTKWSTV